MMIIGLGFDLVSVTRIALLLATDDLFEARTFTTKEREACADRADRAQALAARLAAKEACLKALGTGWGPGISFAQVEVTGGDGLPPRLHLTGGAATRARELGIDHLHVTLTHEGAFAAAAVIAEAREVSPPAG
ncbi:MAG TPA: holo-ACP synthase [Gemmatimonadales bacterium]|nr:holo-ACP synthase [Gemmatimonadales bacterium]